jgi:hypothetical protein
MREYNSQLQEDFMRMHMAELRQEADQYRLVKAALAGQPRRVGLLTRLLHGLGQRMSSWGSRLEARYDYDCADKLAMSPNGDCR